MKTAAIVYHSKTGTTKKYAEEIAIYLKSKGISTRMSSIQTYQENFLNDSDYVFLGCWTNGLMFILQHPDKAWKDFAAKLPKIPTTKLIFFTTYKIRTGSMFRNMYQQIKEKFLKPSQTLQSRDGYLSVSDKLKLDAIIE